MTKTPKTEKTNRKPIVINNRPPNLPSLRSLISDDTFNSLSPEAQQRVMNNQAMEGWSDGGDDSWLHADLLSKEE